MKAYEECLNATSRPWAPWYAIPADDKPYMRLCVAEIIVNTLKRLGLRLPNAQHQTKGSICQAEEKTGKDMDEAPPR